MARLIEYISVGMCSGYGDGDYRVSMEIAKMDRQRYDELRLAVLGALICADRIWRDGQPQPETASGSDSPTLRSPETERVK